MMMMKASVVFVVLLFVGVSFADSNSTNYQCTCKSNVCTNIPGDGLYFLTSFCDQETACGKSCGDCNWYYSTSAMRFGCNKQLKCCHVASGKCATLQVIDSGPACWVENSAGMPIIDASFSTCKLFTGSTSCGYSDKIKVKCSVSDTLLPENLLGPCSQDPKTALKDGIPYCP